MSTRQLDIVKRWSGNPILTIDDVPYPCLGLHSTGAVKLGDTWYLLVRVEAMEGYSEFLVGKSTDGIHFELEAQPILSPATEGPFAKFEAQGLEDPRITLLEDTVYIIYTAHSSIGDRLVLAKTEDFTHIERIAFISEPDNKNGALFPRKINGKYVRVERPKEGYNIWISYSEDLLYWGKSKALLSPRGGGSWDAHHIGCGAPPIEVDAGWIFTYYGIRMTSQGPLFRLGVALLDKENPEKVLGRSNIPIISPRELYERVGDKQNTIYTTGAVLNDDGKTLHIFYGATSYSICLGTVEISELVDRCLGGK